MSRLLRRYSNVVTHRRAEGSLSIVTVTLDATKAKAVADLSATMEESGKSVAFRLEPAVEPQNLLVCCVEPSEAEVSPGPGVPNPPPKSPLRIHVRRAEDGGGLLDFYFQKLA